MDAVNFWVIAGGMAAVAAFSWPVAGWVLRRWRRARHAEVLVHGDAELGIVPLQTWKVKIEDTLDLHTDQLRALMAEHSPNGGKSNWDALVTLDENLRALARDRGVTLPDQRPLRDRKPRR